MEKDQTNCFICGKGPLDHPIVFDLTRVIRSGAITTVKKLICESCEREINKKVIKNP